MEELLNERQFSKAYEKASAGYETGDAKEQCLNMYASKLIYVISSVIWLLL